MPFPLEPVPCLISFILEHLVPISVQNVAREGKCSVSVKKSFYFSLEFFFISENQKSHEVVVKLISDKIKHKARQATQVEYVSNVVMDKENNNKSAAVHNSGTNIIFWDGSIDIIIIHGLLVIY